MSRRGAVPALVVAVAVTAVAVGCAPATGPLGPAPTGAPVPAEGTPPSPSPTAAPSTVVPSATRGVPVGTGPSPSAARSAAITIELWFVRDGRLVPTRRSRPATVATSRLTLGELAAGPSRAEAAVGLGTLVPVDAADVAGIADGVETVLVGADFGSGDPPTVRLRQAQVVYSLTQFPTVSRVVFRTAGRPDPGPAGRDDFADLLPPIVVTAPGIGERVSSPVTVTGTADVFEATVTVRILDGAGRPVATAFTTASCGSGCRGEFRVTIGYRLTATQVGRVEAYQVSPRDGSRTDLVSVPVTLVAQ